MIRYDPIPQFRNVVKFIRETSPDEVPLPTLNFHGTVKAHGTNAAVTIFKNGMQKCQSRNNTLNIENDNHGFAKWHAANEDYFAELANNIHEMIALSLTQHNPYYDGIIVFGEWAGKGIQSGVAISQAEKFFYVFDIKLLYEHGQNQWLLDYEIPPADRILDARKIHLRSLTIDFNNPQMSQAYMIELVEEIENECPIGEHFGISGIGEGIVFKHDSLFYGRLIFKVKGAKHSVTKVKQLAPVDIEKVKCITEFIEYAVTDNRLKQAFSEVCDNQPDRKLMGQFIKWVSTDVKKEEADTLEENGLTMRDIGHDLSTVAKLWFFAREKEEEL